MTFLPGAAQRELRAMNGEVELVCWGHDGERRLRLAERWLRAYEQRCSRFLPDSELSRLNRAAGRAFVASPLLFGLVREALTLAWRSGGVFDPTVLPHLEATGYDRSFESLAEPRPPLSLGERPDARWCDVHLDPATRSITLPAGGALDLGGIGKGWAVDRLASLLGTPCLVNGGGDVMVRGRPPGGSSWYVGVADPGDEERDLCVLALTDRGVATSSKLKRRWRSGGHWLHHLIDARTRRPSDTDVVQATVVAPTTLLADYRAKVVLLLGSRRGIDWLESEEDSEGLLLLQDGTAVATSGWPALLA